MTPGFTILDLAKRWRVGTGKIRTWLRKGELCGVNVAADLDGKPQWRVTAESVELFERRRTSTQPAKPKRRKKVATYREYY